MDDSILQRLDRLIEIAEGAAANMIPPAVPDDSFFQDFNAFRWVREGARGRFVPIRNPHLIDLDDLQGIADAKVELIRNTAQFVRRRPANNVLLWGERGTGKTSCVKGLMKHFAGSLLRIVEVRRDDLRSLPLIMEMLGESSYRFILFCDDLSFREPDESYQELKALLEGGLELPPDNILVYATSNRRHLLPEPMSDNLGGEIHPEEAVSEKLSLADRFGLQLSFYPFNQDRYLATVEHYAAQRNLAIDPGELRREALRWALYRGQRSGRAARQFVDDLHGRLALEDENL